MTNITQIKSSTIKTNMADFLIRESAFCFAQERDEKVEKPRRLFLPGRFYFRR